MDPREELYTALVAALKSIDEVKHVDLWNQQTDFMEEESPFEMPAVFIELGDIEWNVLKDAFRGWGDIKLHTAIAWSEQAPIEAWRLTDKIWRAMEGITGDFFSGNYPETTQSNRSHMEVFENIDIFKVKYLKPWGKGEEEEKQD